MTPDIGLGNWMAQRALRTPQRAALTFDAITWTYAELQQRIDRLATLLRDHGVARGDRVGFLGLNQPAFFETMFAAARLGAVFVPLNFRLSGPELRYIIDDAEIHTLVVDAPHRAVIDGVRADLRCRHYWSADAPAEGWPAIAVAQAATPLAAGEPVAADGNQVAEDRGRAGSPARAPAVEHQLADGLALDEDRVERVPHRGERMLQRDHRRMHPHCHIPVDLLCDGEQLDDVAEQPR